MESVQVVSWRLTSFPKNVTINVDDDDDDDDFILVSWQMSEMRLDHGVS